MFELKIDTGNAAFGNDGMGGDYNERAEIKRVLLDAIERLEAGYDDITLIDINGNKVGEAKFEAEASYHEYEVTVSRNGIARVKAMSEEEAENLADALGVDDIEWDKDFEVGDAELLY